MTDIAVASIVAEDLTPVALRDVAIPQPLSGEVIRGSDAYQALAADWERLLAMQPGPLPFLAPALLSTWAKHFVGDRSSALATVVVRNRGRTILIWPLLVERRGLVRIACSAGAPISQYDDVLVDPEADVEAALTAALEVLARTSRPDVIILERVRADSMLRRALGTRGQAVCGEGAPYLDLSAGLAAALGRRKPYAAKQQRKRMKRFAKAGQSTVAVASNPSDAEAWLHEALGLKRDWLRESGLVSRAFVREATGACLGELAQTLLRVGAEPRTVVARLTLDGRTAAIEAGFVHRGTFHLYLRAFAPEFANLGPGNVLTEHMIGWCVENGVGRYDLLSPRSRNKAEWQSDEVLVSDFVVPITWSGKAYAASVPTFIRPALRSAFYALPPGLRSRIAGMTLRM